MELKKEDTHDLVPLQGSSEQDSFALVTYLGVLVRGKERNQCSVILGLVGFLMDKCF
jgi:hypothetical protein